MEPKTVDETLKERGEKYGDSWLTPNLAIQAMTGGKIEKLRRLIESGHFANWFMILGKLCRAIYSPDHIDHWIDIAGYAQISIDYLQKGEHNSKS